MKKKTRIVAVIVLIALLTGLMPFTVLADNPSGRAAALTPASTVGVTPPRFDRDDSGEARYTRHDGLTFSYNGTHVTLGSVNTAAPFFAINVVDGLDISQISLNLEARGYNPITLADLTNFIAYARAFNARQETGQQSGQQGTSVPPGGGTVDELGDDPVLVPEWWFHGDRYANLEPGVNRTNPASMLRDMRTAIRGATPSAGTRTTPIQDMPLNQPYDRNMRNAMQNNFTEFGTNFPFNQTFFDSLTGSDRLRNVIFRNSPGNPLGTYSRGAGVDRQATIALNANPPSSVPPEVTQFFEVMRHFGMDSSMAGGATRVVTGQGHRPQTETSLLDHHTFLEQMLIQRIGEVEFLATAFWGNEDRLDHHVRALFGPYGFTLENIQYAKTYDNHQRTTTGQWNDRSLLINSFINAFCKELNLTPQQRARYKDIARREIDRLSARAQALELSRQSAFMGEANNDNPTGLEMIPMRRSHLEPHMFPTRQHYLDAKYV